MTVSTNSKTKTASVLLLGMAAVVLAACTANKPYYPSRTGIIDTPARNEVTVTPFSHGIELSAGQTGLSAEQSEALGQFLAGIGRDTGDHYELRTAFSSAANGERNSAVATQIRKSFIQQGVYVDRLHMVNVPGHEDRLELVVRRYVVMAPECWYEQEKADHDWTIEWTDARRLGCSNEQNLGMMIADPRDLVGSRTGPGADAERESIAVERYRTDTIEDLPSPGGEEFSVRE